MWLFLQHGDRRLETVRFLLCLHGSGMHCHRTLLLFCLCHHFDGGSKLTFIVGLWNWLRANIITGPLTHGVGGQTSNGHWCMSSSSSSVGNRGLQHSMAGLQAASPVQARRCRYAASSLIIAPWLHGGPVVLRPVRATPCYFSGDNSVHWQFSPTVFSGLEVTLTDISLMLAFWR